jgi:hypothetical protein
MSFPPAKPGVAPPPIGRETYLDDPSVPTTRMSSDSIHDVKPLGTITTTTSGQAVGPPDRPADQAGSVRFITQPMDADTSAALPATNSK